MEITDTKRPTINDPAVIRAAAEKLLPNVKAWLEQDRDKQDEWSDEEITDQLFKAMLWGSDGYELAKNLDRWSPDAALVEILDSAVSYKFTARDKACVEWMETRGLSAPEIGARVTWAKEPNRGAGTVKANDNTGRATVAFDNQEQRLGRTLIGTCVPWEELLPE